MKYFNLAALSALLLLHASSASACMKASITYSPATRTLVSATLWDNGIEICHLAIGRPPSNPNAVDLECIAVDGARWTARVDDAEGKPSIAVTHGTFAEQFLLGRVQVEGSIEWHYTAAVWNCDLAIHDEEQKTGLPLVEGQERKLGRGAYNRD